VITLLDRFGSWAAHEAILTGYANAVPYWPAMPHLGKCMPAGAVFGGTGILPVIRPKTGKMPVLL